MKKKCILMIYDHLDIGGIETFIIRASKWFIEHGYDVKLVLHTKGNIFNELDKRVQVRTYPFLYGFLFTPAFAKFIFKGEFFKDFDVVQTFRPESLWIASVLAKVQKRPIKVFNCVYHPREFFFHGDKHYQTTYFPQIIKSGFPHKNFAFMNAPTQTVNEKFFNIKFNESPTVLVALDVNRYRDAERTPKKFKIVSIGNFKDFKTYNVYMIDIVAKLIKEGFPVEYQIYGEGELKPEMKKRIKETNMEEHVHINGQVKYEVYKSVLKDAYLFVGVGTAAVEAALCKVPTIIPTENTMSALTHGFVYDMPGFSGGEYVDGVKEYPVEQLVRDVIAMNDAQYQELAMKCFTYSTKYDLDEVLTGLSKKFSEEGELAYYDFENMKNSVYSNFYFDRMVHNIKTKFRAIKRKLNISPRTSNA